MALQTKSIFSSLDDYFWLMINSDQSYEYLGIGYIKKWVYFFIFSRHKKNGAWYISLQN